MSIAEIKQQLHEYIDVANDKDVADIYSFIENKSAQSKYSEDELNEFYRRRDNFLSGKSKGYSVEEVHSFIRNGKKGL